MWFSGLGLLVTSAVTFWIGFQDLFLPVSLAAQFVGLAYFLTGLVGLVGVVGLISLADLARRYTFVGAHVAILEAWLAGELDGDVEELASMALDLLIYGAAWAHGFRLDELGYSTGSPADARIPSSD